MPSGNGSDPTLTSTQAGGWGASHWLAHPVPSQYVSSTKWIVSIQGRAVGAAPDDPMVPVPAAGALVPVETAGASASDASVLVSPVTTILVPSTPRVTP